MPTEGKFTYPTKAGHTVVAYVIEGRGSFCQAQAPFSYELEGKNYFDLEAPGEVANGGLVQFGDGDQIVVATDDEPVRFLLMTGKPIGEPVAWYGPIVMNTLDELQVAFDEYQNGTFLKT